MSYADDQYCRAIRTILDRGIDKPDRTGTGVRSYFGGLRMNFSLQNNAFPILTKKKVPFRGTIRELLWILSGSTNAYDLHESVQPWWLPWADEDGELGPIYGHQWRKGRDQLLSTISNIKNNPNSRRHVISLWGSEDLPDMRLPCCHGTVIQFWVNPIDSSLSCSMYQRSADMFIGVPVNIASYSILTHMIAQVCELKPKEFIHIIGDAHIYHNHMTAIGKYMSQRPYPGPTLKVNPDVKDILAFTVDDFELENYRHSPAIAADLAV